jgi:hypothetical protein
MPKPFLRRYLQHHVRHKAFRGPKRLIQRYQMDPKRLKVTVGHSLGKGTAVGSIPTGSTNIIKHLRARRGI